MKNSSAIASFYNNPNIIGVTPLQSVEFNGVLTSISECVFVHQFEQSLPLFLQQSQKNPQQKHDLAHNWQLLLQHLTRVVLPEIYVFFHDTSCRVEQRQVIHQKIDKVLRQFRQWTDYSPVQLQIISQNNLYQGDSVDNYLVNTGQYGSMASNLLPLMMLSNVNGNLYLKDIAPLFSVLLDNHKLERFLLQDSLLMIEQLEDWTDRRLANFSQPTSEELANHSQILCEKQHPLIKHVQQDFKLSVVKNELELIQSDNDLPDKDEMSIKQRFWDSDDKYISIFQKIAIVAILFLWCMFPLLVTFGFVIAFFIFKFPKHNDYLEDNHIEQPKKINQKNSIKQKVKKQQPKKDKNKENNLFPLQSHREGRYLKKLFSHKTFSIFRKLVNVMNDTYKQLDYLQEHHPYLANSVSELLMDIAVNTIIRLNQQAENFVHQDRVDDMIKARFAKEHEKNILQLLTNHITEVTALKESIIAKQMAGFANFGSEQERQFREAVMELKILLNWFVAQENNETVSKYAFIKEKIEDEMLTKMENIYYQAETTGEQKDELYEQIQELLNYFKSQSPQSAHGQFDFAVVDTSHLLGESETQQFIDFNKYYLKELQKHW